MTTIKVTDNHLQVINKALEVYYRLKSGQIAIAYDIAFDLKSNDSKLLEALTRKFTHKDLHHSNSSYGIGHPAIGDGSLAYEIKKTFEEYLAVTKNKGYYGGTVDFDGPLKVTDEKLPEIVDFKQYKDYPVVNAKKAKKIIDYKLKEKYNEMWDIIDTIPGIPRGDKTEVILWMDEVQIRVWKPRKNHA